MAAPHVTGAFALLRQCVDGNGVEITNATAVARLNATGPQITDHGATRRRIDVFAAAKGLVNIVRAVEQVDEVRLRIVGPSVTEEERVHRIALERLVIDLGLLDRVDIAGPVPRHAVPSLYADVDALVNDMREGAADKVVYEAAATCLPVIASNQAFASALVSNVCPVIARIAACTSVFVACHAFQRASQYDAGGLLGELTEPATGSSSASAKSRSGRLSVFTEAK